MTERGSGTLWIIPHATGYCRVKKKKKGKGMQKCGGVIGGCFMLILDFCPAPTAMQLHCFLQQRTGRDVCCCSPVLKRKCNFQYSNLNSVINKSEEK